MKKLIMILIGFITFIVLMNVLNLAFELISSPDSFLVGLGLVIICILVFLIYILIKFFKKTWKK